MDEKREKDIYRYIKIWGLLSFIPLILAAGPFAGFECGEFLVRRFGLPDYTTAFAAAIGFIASVRETIRIIRLALKTEKDIAK
jgi:hypothetical protein